MTEPPTKTAARALPFVATSGRLTQATSLATPPSLARSAFSRFGQNFRYVHDPTSTPLSWEILSLVRSWDNPSIVALTTFRALVLP